MSIELYDASIPVFVKMMRNLSALLDKGEAWAKANGVDAATLIEARLAPDMFPLARQVQIVSDGAKGAAARLARIEAPSYADTDTTFDELKARLAKTIAFVEAVTPDQVNGDEGRIVELKFPNRTLTYTAKDFLFQFALPNFMFHVVTAYGLMRQQGAPLGKMDYLAGADMPA